MKSTRLMLLFCCLLLGGRLEMLQAQKGTVTKGGDLTGINGNVSYSIGQIDFSTQVGPGGTVTQGLQQPYEIWVVTGLDVTGIELKMAAYPNPAIDYLMLQTEEIDWTQLRYQLFDTQGQLLADQSLQDQITKINMSSYARGLYFLKVSAQTKELRTFKIIKNQ